MDNVRTTREFSTISSCSNRLEGAGSMLFRYNEAIGNDGLKSATSPDLLVSKTKPNKLKRYGLLNSFGACNRI